jgi:dinuclear metal center YbgI/SA1388 family protein
VGLAQDWDNVGLLAGDTAARVRQVLLTIDLTPAVVDEAIQKKVEVIVAYHPPIFRPISRLCGPGTGMEAVVLRCLQHGMAIYALHTALDAADGGTNDVLAALCGIKESTPLEYVDAPRPEEVKLVVFVPPANLDAVAEAMFAAGAGHIGDYSRCSYRLEGEGTFFGGESTSPTIGERGRMEFVEEVRFETVVPRPLVSAVVAAMVKAHPYEEPAFDLYPLMAQSVRGHGRCGSLPRPMTVSSLARKLKRSVPAPAVQIVGPADRTVTHAVVCVGAAGSWPFKAALSPQHVVVTGEIRHHDALTILRHDATAIALGHWSSERPVLAAVQERLSTALPGVETAVSQADQEPFGAA